MLQSRGLFLVQTMLSALALTGLVLIGSTVEVVGATDTCPSVAQVEEQLQATPGGPPPASFRVRISRSNNELLVEMRDETDGRLIGEKVLPSGQDCEIQARAIGAVVATWLRDPTAAAIQPAPRAPSPAEATPTTMMVAAGQPPLPPSPSRPLFWASAGAFASWTSSDLVPGMEVAAGVRPARSPFGLRAALYTTTARTVPLNDPPLAASWRRIAGGLGPSATVISRAILCEAHAELLLARVVLHGQPPATSGRATGTQLGGASGVRVGLMVGPLVPWVGAQLLYWQGAQDIEVGDGTPRRRLPHLEAQLGGGASVGF